MTNWRRGWDSKDFYWRRRSNNRSLTEFQLSNDARQRRWRRNARTSPPGAPLTNFNDGGVGGSDRGSYFIPKKNHNFRICLPKKSLLFLAYPKESLSPFFATQKNPSFVFATQKNHSDPPVIKICKIVQKFVVGTDFEAYAEQLEFYFLANGVTDLKQKAVLLTNLPTET